MAITDEQIKQLQLASDFAYQLWLKQPDAAQNLLARYPLGEPIAADLPALIEAFTGYRRVGDGTSVDADEAGVMAGLRQLRNLLMLRWIWQDALGVICLEQLTGELSAFADACLIFAKHYSYQRLVPSYGEPMLDEPAKTVDDLAIIAMGKLGAKELNLSSDIDLIFVHQGQGETSGGKKTLDNKKFFAKWGQKIIELLAKPTADGFVFRVDMRLRPWGEGSDLTIHLAALDKYFAQHGRAWERFAWLKARLVNPVSFEAALMSIIKPFVFRYYVDFTTVAALREMKSLIEQQVAQRQDLDNVKLGAGGIRDIEFIVQSFQLIYGGRVAGLQVKHCLIALQRLYELDYLDKATYQQLEAAYRFLRRLEHGIQALHDEQTQQLPTQADEQRRLAAVLGFANWQALLDQLGIYRQYVIAPFESLVSERQQPNDLPAIDHAANLVKLSERLSEDNRKRLADFWQSKLVAGLSDEARQRLTDLYPILVHAMTTETLEPAALNLALPRLINLLEAVSRRSVYLVMLSENPAATAKLLPMLAASPWIANELASYPVLLDSFLREKYRHLPDKAELGAILREQLLRVEPSDDEALLNAFRFFKKSQVLAVAASEILAERPTMKVSDSLTFIAEVVLEKAMERVFVELSAKHGYPKNRLGEPVTQQHNGFAIIGYGKLGGIELSYSSDLDLVFLHDIDEEAMTDGDKPITGLKFAMRLAQRLMNYLTTQTRDGRAYEIDMRLRPSGQAGMLVVSVQGFERYQYHHAWLWEHQALVRARAICGDNHVMTAFADIRRQVLCLPRDPDTVRVEVATMRHKMHDQLGSKPHVVQQGLFHLKQDEGGVVDIEFMAQFAVLAYAHRYPNLAIWSDNVRIFEQLAQTDILPKAVCQALTEAYLSIRTTIHRRALAELSVVVPEAPWHALRQFVSGVWDKLIGYRPSPDKIME